MKPFKRIHSDILSEAVKMTTVDTRNLLRREIPTGNAQLVYGINGCIGEVFAVKREGTMLPKGSYRVVAVKVPNFVFGTKSFSTLVVEKVKL